MTNGRQGGQNRSRQCQDYSVPLIGGQRRLVGGSGSTGRATAHGPRDPDVGIALIDHTYKHSSAADRSGDNGNPTVGRPLVPRLHRAPGARRSRGRLGKTGDPGRLQLADGDLKDPAVEVLDSTMVYSGHGADIMGRTADRT